MSRALWNGPFTSILAIMLICAGLVQGATILDNFDDNTIDPNLWDLIENGAALDEANQRVEFTSLEVLPRLHTYSGLLLPGTGASLRQAKM